MTTWDPGEVIVRREVWRGHPWAALPVRVVEDGDELLALYVQEGAPFGFAQPPVVGRHPWAAEYERWEGHGVLMLQRPGDAYAVFVFWRGADRTFDRWYLNLQDPFRRTPIGIDTYDHTLDLWSREAETWHVKDDDTLDVRVAEGRFTAAEAAAIRAEGERLLGELREQGPWWDEAWARWAPDAAWTVPELRGDWAS